MITILFLCQGGPDHPAMAAACTEFLAGGRINARVAAAHSQPDTPRVITLLRDKGLHWPDSILPLEECRRNPFNFDLGVCFCEGETSLYPELPGNPTLLRWNLHQETMLPLEAVFQRIRHMVADLLQQGYLDALLSVRRNAELILDNLSEGIIAHDLGRRFFFFNRAAEEITGLSRQEVLGQDCHAIFPDKFCSSHCSFCNGMALPDFPNAPYPVTIRSRDGETKQVEMFVVPLKDSRQRPIGVVASLRDMTREFELAQRLGEIEQFAGIIGRDSKMQAIYQTIRELAERDVPVLIQGESGTGKELVASAIHNEGNRAGKRFVTINCGALPDTLLESELFGHVRGAFTGAIRDKKGRFELADGGTIFLDEVGDVSPAMQVKLLRVLQDGTFQRLGSEHTVRVDVRVISATHKNLREEIAAGNFREDLYYRLCVVPVLLPPLRERRHDIPLLVEHFLRHDTPGLHAQPPTLAHATLDLLMEFDWPGNIRELQNIIRYLLVKCPQGLIEPRCLPPDFRPCHLASVNMPPRAGKRGKLEQDQVRRALQQTAGNKVRAAQLLGVGRATLYRFLDHNSGDV